ncbi:hypothetical protein N431DRAFT_415637 [Stipitochalara longipes BDJ]|nr:hypothetical protein N431DRAFT_415637 [Stipitochalara longipes BDJ]
MASNTSSSDPFSASTSSTTSGKDKSLTPEDDSRNSGPQAGNSKNQPGYKNACSTCRKRKIKCDGVTPSCGRCARMKLDCAYEESRKKSGPRRGYVRGLQERLAQAEGLLKSQGTSGSGGNLDQKTEAILSESNDYFQDFGLEGSLTAPDELGFSSTEIEAETMQTTNAADMFPQSTQHSQANAFLTEDFSWAMIELGVQEPLPPKDTIDELTQIYFAKVYPSAPIIHKYHFLSSQPPISLQYALWAHAATITPKYVSLHPHFHLRARKYAELDETSGRQRYINIRHAQAWILIGLYEFKNTMFPNAWMTTGRATRLTQMLGLHRLDGLGVEVKQTLPKETDVGKMEERRRTFWMAFSMDRYAGVGTGWPLIIDERDISTHLPSTEEAFEQNTPGPGISLAEALNPTNAPLLSSFAGVAVVASLTGRILQHLQRPSPPSNSLSDTNTNTPFWRTHRTIDHTLLAMSLHFPTHLRLPYGSSNPNTIFLHMSLQSAIICLHQAAIFKSSTNLNTNTAVVHESKARCLAAGMEIARIMKMIAHTDLSLLNIYTPFALHLAVRIFARVLQSVQSEAETEDSVSNMRFLLSALVALRETNPLAESYLIQLDLEGVGLAALQANVEGGGIALRFEELERGLAGMTVQEPINEAEWITFVSPLVRIVEETEKGTSPSNSNSARGGSSTSDGPKGKKPMTVPAEAVSFEIQADVSADGLDAAWKNNLGDMQEDLFDSLMDFGLSP